MTTPKSPDTIMKEFEEYKELLNDHKNFEKGEYEGDSAEAWLRSSMASLLCYMAERMGKHKEGDGGWCDTGEDMDWECRSECVESARSVLIEEARKITNNE